MHSGSAPSGTRAVLTARPAERAGLDALSWEYHACKSILSILAILFHFF